MALFANHIIRKTNCTKYILVWLVVFATTNSSWAQTVSATLSKYKMLLGEQTTLTLKLTANNGQPLQTTTWFNLPDTFNHLEIVDRLPIDTLEVNGSIIAYQQKIVLTSFDSGYWEIPHCTIILTNNQQLQSKALHVTVLPVNVSGLKEYHPIKEIIEVEPETDWENWLLLGGIVVAALLLGYFIFRYMKHKKAQLPIKTAEVFSINQILAQIDALQPLIEQKKYKPLFTGLIGICRNFSDAQLYTRTINLTTDEYMLHLQGKIGTEPVQVQYFQLLRLADAVKFAQFKPSNSQCADALQQANNFVQTMYRFTIKNNTHAV